MTNEEKAMKSSYEDAIREIIGKATEIYKYGFEAGYDACLIEKVNSIFEDIDNLPWYHINEHGEVVEGSNSDYETFYKAKDIFDVLAKYGYEDYDG